MIAAEIDALNLRHEEDYEYIDFDLEPFDWGDVCPFTVIVDTREQAPFHFVNCDPWPLIPIWNIALATGDYSISGFEDRMTIERKSISDLLGSITAGRDRFEREFERMNSLEFAAVVIEGQLSNVLRHARDNTSLQLKSIIGTFDAWRIRYPRVHWVFCLDRRHAELQTLGLMQHFWKEEQKRLKEGKRDTATKTT